MHGKDCELNLKQAPFRVLIQCPDGLGINASLTKGGSVMVSQFWDIILYVVKSVLAYICYKCIDCWFDTIRSRKNSAKKPRRFPTRRRKKQFCRPCVQCIENVKKPLSIAVDKGFGVISKCLKPVWESSLYLNFSILSTYFLQLRWTDSEVQETFLSQIVFF